MAGLNPDNNHPGYLLGRLHAMLGELEQLVTGIDDPIMGRTGKLMETAPTNPAVTLYCWQREGVQWLRNLSAGNPQTAQDLGARIAEVADRVDLPTSWTVDERSLWVVGYHHQRAAGTAITTSQVAELRGLATSDAARTWLARHPDLVCVGRDPDTGEKLWPRAAVLSKPRRPRGRPKAEPEA